MSDGGEFSWPVTDGAYRLTKYIKDPDGSPANQQWTLDGVYNWSQFIDYGTTETRTYNSVNELTDIDTNNDTDFDYDANGNVITQTDDPGPGEVVKVYMWDDLNRLKKIKVAGNDEAIFIYDFNNQRVRKEYDSDEDGICDFDEENRFENIIELDKNNEDTDGDGILDLQDLLDTLKTMGIK